MAIDTGSTNYDAAVQRSTTRWISDLADNNSEAMRVLYEGVAIMGMTRGLALLRDVEATGLRGSAIWELYVDECGSALNTFATLCAEMARHAK